MLWMFGEMDTFFPYFFQIFSEYLNLGKKARTTGGVFPWFSQRFSYQGS